MWNIRGQKCKRHFEHNQYERRDLLHLEHAARYKHRSLVQEYHCQLIKFLVLEADIIIMPHMKVSRITCGRRLVITTKCELLGWSHSEFLIHLSRMCFDIMHNRQFKADRRNKGPVLLVQPEGNTSKTCGKCGSLHNRLGPSTMFVCLICAYQAGQDQNAVFNMIIKPICAYAFFTSLVSKCTKEDKTC